MREHKYKYGPFDLTKERHQFCTVNFGNNDVPLGKKKGSICEVSLYPKYTNYGNMYTCMYGCRILCMFYMRDMMYHTFVHMYNVIYLRTCGCTVCWRTTLACFSLARALSHAFSA